MAVLTVRPPTIFGSLAPVAASEPHGSPAAGTIAARGRLFCTTRE